MARMLLRDRKNPRKCNDTQGTPRSALARHGTISSQSPGIFWWLAARTGWFRELQETIERDQEQRNNNFTLNFIKRYLVILDDLDRALKTRPTQGDGAGWSVGVELIYRKLQNYLEMEGVRPIPTDQKTFDPTLHEAISHEASPDHGSGEIIEVVQQGYMLGDRVLRPALVRVAQ
jgi:molecular chaperone GrpE